MADYQINRWISFVRQYGPIPRNDNMYDEHIQRAIRRRGVKALRLDTGLLDGLVDNFSGSTPSSVVLTGTAGDGKTFLCREVWSALGGTDSDWDAEGKIRSLTLKSGCSLTVIKDLSELQEGDHSILSRMAASAMAQAPTEVFLVAANDGQLVEAWNKTPASSEVEQVKNWIVDLLVAGEVERPGVRIKLYNLSCTDTAELFRKLIAEIVRHPGWTGCNGCRGQLPERDSRCPIWENYERLKDPLFIERLSDLLELCDRSGFHLPMRQLLLVASNILLGHPRGKDALLQCKDVPEVTRTAAAFQGSIYSNVFGGNLSASRRAGTEVFEVLGRFGIGEETSNRIDNLLVFGAADQRLAPLFGRLIAADATYGAHPTFLQLQAEYLEGTSDEASRAFIESMVSQRQRLFFAIPPSDAAEFGLWELTVFRFAGEYLEQVVRTLARGERTPRPILSRLVQGMNRVFTGLLSKTDRELVLASSGSFSQSRISRIEEYSISVESRKGEKVALENSRGSLEFAVYLDTKVRVPLRLNVLRYEFLSRVAEGALPSSFSRECYEDILSYKSRLLREWLNMKQTYGEDDSAQDEMELRLLDVDSRGKIITKALTIRL